MYIKRHLHVERIKSSLIKMYSFLLSTCFVGLYISYFVLYSDSSWLNLIAVLLFTCICFIQFKFSESLNQTKNFWIKFINKIVVTAIILLITFLYIHRTNSFNEINFYQLVNSIININLYLPILIDIILFLIIIYMTIPLYNQNKLTEFMDKNTLFNSTKSHISTIKNRFHQENLKLSASQLQQTNEGLFILNEDFQYIDANSYYGALIGLHHQQFFGKNIFDIILNNKEKQVLMHDSVSHELLLNGQYDNEITAVFLSGHKSTLRFNINAIQNSNNKTTHYMGAVSDLTQIHTQNCRLSYLENFDILTELPNRLYHNYQLNKYILTHQHTTKKLAIIQLNIDRFRLLNKYFTNHGGDELLQQVSQRLRLYNKDALFLARLNSDNFAIVFESFNDHFYIQEKCEKITRLLTRPFHINNKDHAISVSMGISFYPEHGHQIDYLNSRAEQALNKAKRLGGNMTCIYDIQSDIVNEQNIQLEFELRNAIKNNELTVHYQPKVYFKDFKIQSFEALVRWNHPTKGLILPDTFLPIAEQTSLISEIGQFVILNTAKQIQKWKNLGYQDIVVSLNIVAQQLHRGCLLETIDSAIEKYNISGTNLELEITESSLVDNSEAVKATLAEIKKRNIRIAIDDFGIGYSSLSYLTNFPVDTLKIDRSFIAKIGQKKPEALVSAIISMGKTMGMSLVAEGVETKEQFEYLSQHDCDIAQGFLFSEVLTEPDATSYLIQNYSQK